MKSQFSLRLTAQIEIAFYSSMSPFASYISFSLREADSLKFTTNPISVVEMHAFFAHEQFIFNIYLGHIKIGNKEENDFFFSGIFINL